MSEQNADQAAALPAPEDDPKPQRKRTFAGTAAQIKAAATFYKVAAYVTGVMLLLLVVEMVLKYAFKLVIYAGGTNVDGTANVFSMVQEGQVVGGVNVSIAILIAHGWLYVVYLLAVFLLWSRMRWSLGEFIAIALGGVVPFLSFVMEARVHRQVQEDLAANPTAVRRY